MKKSIMLGGIEYTYEIDFEMSYDFLEFRNRLQTGFDFEGADKEIVQEIVNAIEKVDKATQNGIGDIENDLSFLNELSPKAYEFMLKKQKEKGSKPLFTKEEIKKIVSRFTGVTDEKEIMEILNKEIAYSEGGIDTLLGKLSIAISEVFTNAKDNSQPEGKVKVAKK